MPFLVYCLALPVAFFSVRLAPLNPCCFELQLRCPYSSDSALITAVYHAVFVPRVLSGLRKSSSHEVLPTISAYFHEATSTSFLLASLPTTIASAFPITSALTSSAFSVKVSSFSRVTNLKYPFSVSPIYLFPFAVVNSNP